MVRRVIRLLFLIPPAEQVEPKLAKAWALGNFLSASFAMQLPHLLAIALDVAIHIENNPDVRISNSISRS